MGAYEFSGPGDVDRVTGSNTTDASRSNNALAADSEEVLDFGRAFPQPGSGGVVGDDDMINHAYGES